MKGYYSHCVSRLPYKSESFRACKNSLVFQGMLSQNYTGALGVQGVLSQVSKPRCLANQARFKVAKGCSDDYRCKCRGSPETPIALN